MSRFWYYTERLPEDDEDAFSSDEMELIVDMVRESSFFDDESGKSIDERMCDMFTTAPEWIGFQTLDAVCYVNCFGVVAANGTMVKYELQFELSDDLERFSLSGLLIDGVEQSEDAIIEFESRFSAE